MQSAYYDDDRFWRNDLEEQRQAVFTRRRQKHEKWVESHASQTKFAHRDSQIRAELLVSEAARLERAHLQHQLIAAKEAVKAVRRNRTIGANDATPSPRRSRMARRHASRDDVDSSHLTADFASPPRQLPACGCLGAPLHRQLNLKYRAMNLLKGHFDEAKIEETVESLRQTYPSDAEMLEDLKYRYGPEEETHIDEVDPLLRLKCVEERLSNIQWKWQAIGQNVKEEMKHRDNFAQVIRNLSIMRIFLEGSQASNYGCDMSERARRDAHHQSVLDDLHQEGALFVTPRRVR